MQFKIVFFWFLIFCVPVILNGVRVKNKRRDQKPIEYRIPRIIHQIWVGGPVPEKYKLLMKSWIDKHPDWQYILWTDADVDGFQLENRDIFDAAQNFGLKADIWRYEIVWRYGGVFLDIDFDCIKPLDDLHIRYDLYGARLAPHCSLANGVIGAAPHHPVLRACIQGLRRCRSKSPVSAEDIMRLAGPGLFTRCFLKFIRNNPHTHAKILPPESFFPFPSDKRYEFWHHLMNPEEMRAYIRSGTYAVHYWACSWSTPGATEGTLPFTVA